MSESMDPQSETVRIADARGEEWQAVSRRPVKRRARRSDSEIEIDVQVGKRLHQRRVLLGLTQKDLAKGLGVTFQQLQMYEKGNNRISAGMLYACAGMLNVPVEYFFEGLDRPRRRSPEELRSDEALKLARAYLSIDDPTQRQRVRKLVETIAFGTD